MWGCLAVKHIGSVNVEMKFLKRFVMIGASYTSCIVWVKCTTSAEFKQSIRIAASAVMDMLGDFTRGVVFIKLWDGTAVWHKSYGCVN